jgi:hypothetical protein
LYRTQAARSGAYAGVSDPEFGPTKKLTFQGERWEDGGNGRRQKRSFEDSIEYPEWCRVCVTRMVDGTPREFSAREYWLENYATKGASSSEPNAMWKKRPFGQIAKCAEAQALRKAFPEMTGSSPTAEEMEGKSFQHDEDRTLEATPLPAASQQQQKPAYPEDDFAKNLPTWRKHIEAGKKSADDVIATIETKGRLSDEQKRRIRDGEKPAAAAAATDVTPKGEAPTVTYALVADAIAKAKDADALATAGDLIAQVGDEQQRTELQALFDTREAELKG